MALSVDLIGYVAAGLTTASFFPQALKTLRTGDTRAISLGMYTLFTSGVALWFVYGYCVGDGPVMAANLINSSPCGCGVAAEIDPSTLN